MHTCTSAFLRGYYQKTKKILVSSLTQTLAVLLYIAYSLFRYFVVKRIRCFCIGICIFFLDGSAIAQMDSLLGSLYDKDSLKIQLYLRKPAQACGENARLWQYKIVVNHTEYIKKNRFLSWKILTENCEGYKINRAFSVNLNDHQIANDIPLESKDWNFIAKQLLGSISDARLDSIEHIERDANLGLVIEVQSRAGHIERDTNLVVQAKSVETSLSRVVLPAADKVTRENSRAGRKWVTLTVSSPSLPKGADWYWFLDSCATTRPEAMGSKLEFSPQRDVTVYVRSYLAGRFSPCYAVRIKHYAMEPPYSVADISSELIPMLYEKIKYSPNSWSIGVSLLSFEKFSKLVRPVLVFREFQLLEHPVITIGYYAGISVYRNKEVVQSYSIAFPSIGVRSSIYSSNILSHSEAPLRLYAGVSTGFTGALSGWKRSALQEPERFTPVGFNITLHIGTSYSISPKYDLFAEVSGIVAPLTIGLKINNLLNKK